jgi:hypothetical protein
MQSVVLRRAVLRCDPWSTEHLGGTGPLGYSLQTNYDKLPPARFILTHELKVERHLADFIYCEMRVAAVEIYARLITEGPPRNNHSKHPNDKFSPDGSLHTI